MTPRARGRGARKLGGNAVGELREYVAREGARIAYVTVSQRGTWSYEHHPDPDWPGSSSSCSSYSSFTREDALACQKAGLPVVRFDKARSELGIAAAFHAPLPTTGESYDKEPRRSEGEAPRWGSMQRVHYLRHLRILQAAGIPVEWNRGIEFRTPPLDEADQGTVARIQEAARRPRAPPAEVEPVDEPPFDSIEAILREAALEGVVECRGCGMSLEPDCARCGDCGWRSPLIRGALI